MSDVHDVKTVLELQAVTKQYGSGLPPAVDGVDLTVRKGEFVTLLGPSGSGKTTTLNMIAGFTSPTSGQILLDGRDLKEVPPHLRNLGMVFQNYGLFPHMTVWDNVAFPLVERKLPKREIRQKVAASLAMVDLSDFGSRRPRELSGGQQQRVALVRALVFGPPLLLMDEPLGALDKRLREHLQLEIRRIHRDLGITFLFVTHDQEEAMTMSDTVVVFNRGRIEQVGTPAELYRRPASRFVAEFVGDSNVIEGSLERRGQVWTLTTGDGPVVLHDWVAPAGTASGDACLLFRPEDVLIHGEADGDGWKGEIREVAYLGSEERVIVETATGATLRVRLTGAELNQRRRVGDHVRLEFMAANAWLLPRG